MISPTCGICLNWQATGDDGTGPSVLSARTLSLGSPVELAAFAGLARTELTHVAVASGVLDRYDFDDVVECSFPGAHRHKKGLVVRMVCGEILAIGHDCGKKSVVGYKNIQKHVDRTDAHFGRIAAIKRHIERLPGRVDALVEENEKFIAFRKNITDLVPSLPKTWRDIDVRRTDLRGLSVWHPTDSREADSLKATVHGLQKRDTDALDEKSAKRVVEALNRADEDTRRLETWAGEARLFFERDNLQRAVEAATLPADIRVTVGEDNVLSVDRRGRVYRVGLHEFTPPSSPPRS